MLQVDGLLRSYADSASALRIQYSFCKENLNAKYFIFVTIYTYTKDYIEGAAATTGFRVYIWCELRNVIHVSRDLNDVSLNNTKTVKIQNYLHRFTFSYDETRFQVRVVYTNSSGC